MKRENSIFKISLKDVRCTNIDGTVRLVLPYKVAKETNMRVGDYAWVYESGKTYWLIRYVGVGRVKGFLLRSID